MCSKVSSLSLTITAVSAHSTARANSVPNPLLVDWKHTIEDEMETMEKWSHCEQEVKQSRGDIGAVTLVGQDYQDVDYQKEIITMELPYFFDICLEEIWTGHHAQQHEMWLKISNINSKLMSLIPDNSK